MDAWWPRLLQAEFEPVHGQAAASTSSRRPTQIDNAPNNHGDHLGSAYQEGWYGYVLKDLRRVLRRPVAQKYAARLLRARQAGRVPQGPRVAR